MIQEVLALFLARMAGGYAVSLGLVGDRVDEGSWRKVSLFTITGLTIVAWVAGAAMAPAIAIIAVALVLERAIAFDLPVLKRVVWMLPLGAWFVVATEWDNTLGVDSGLSAILAGGTLGTMLMGHSYLTARGLSFQPLKWMSLLLLAVVVVRAAFVAPLFFRDGLEMGDVVMLSMRAAFGLFLPLVFGWMVWQCAKIESNQSATGILYAMTVGVFIGELIAVYLKLTRGIAA